uniref:Putative secreted protein n=1 Tax=Anopheles triannulatus TaxID=58253 RepID=A0A2M4B6M2_9DIPT
MDTLFLFPVPCESIFDSSWPLLVAMIIVFDTAMTWVHGTGDYLMTIAVSQVNSWEERERGVNQMLFGQNSHHYHGSVMIRNWIAIGIRKPPLADRVRRLVSIFSIFLTHLDLPYDVDLILLCVI